MSLTIDRAVAPSPTASNSTFPAVSRQIKIAVKRGNTALNWDPHPIDVDVLVDTNWNWTDAEKAAKDPLILPISTQTDLALTNRPNQRARSRSSVLTTATVKAVTLTKGL